MDISWKFIVSWLIIISITYTASGYIYAESYDDVHLKIDPISSDTVDNFILDALAYVVNGIIWFINVIIALFSVMFFALPHMPWQVMVILDIFFIPLNIIWFLGIYPYIRDFLTLIVEYSKAAAEWLDAIIPF